jgi:TonB family protein
MIADLAEPQRWKASRWWAIIGLVFITQLGLIYWLGKPNHSLVVRNNQSLAFQLTSPNAGPEALEALALSDPTLFALPHREGFSGQAWLTIRAQESPPFVWPDVPYSLAPIQDLLGTDFQQFMATNQQDNLPSFAQPELLLKQPEVVATRPFQTESTLRLAGVLAGQHLLSLPVLPSWRSPEILTNSVVQLMIGADGKPLSCTLLKSSGSAEVDQYALREARRASIPPLPFNNPTNPLAALAWGQLVFEWHTLPLASTNTVVEPVLPK